MKHLLFTLLLLTACLLAGSCSDDDNDGAWFLPRTLQVMDAKTDAPRANEPLTLNFIGDGVSDAFDPKMKR